MNTDAPALPIPWRKSKYSTATGNCVEVAPTADGVLIRHSKRPTTGTIIFPLAAWTAFVREARNGLINTNGTATITKIGTNTLVRSLSGAVELRFDAAEWSAFLAGAADGEFDFTSRLVTTAS